MRSESVGYEKGVLERIAFVKQKLGTDLCILAHFYQNDTIVRFADFVGDSLRLAEQAAQNHDAKYIVFCSVSFMAEMARILCRPEQEVLHPEPSANCPLARMADIDSVETAWRQLSSLNKKIVPIVYVNSDADLKAFCARNGGTVCTSANVKKIFRYFLDEGSALFFFPDENMGRNISRDLGIAANEIYQWSADTVIGQPDIAGLQRMKVFLWEGFCIVHRLMKAGDVERVRSEHKGIKVIVHPECTPEVYNLADYAGSTSFIRDTVEKAPPGSKWAIGTECNFVNRIKSNNPDKLVIPLKEERCREMAKTTPERLLYVLEGLAEGELRNRVVVDADVARQARIALNRMLDIT